MRTGSTLIRVMVCSFIGTKPLLVSMITYCQLGSQEWLTVESESRYNHFHSEKCIWKCCLQNVSHFVQASMHKKIKRCNVVIISNASSSLKRNIIDIYTTVTVMEKWKPLSGIIYSSNFSSHSMIFLLGKTSWTIYEVVYTISFFMWVNGSVHPIYTWLYELCWPVTKLLSCLG